MKRNDKTGFWWIVVICAFIAAGGILITLNNMSQTSKSLDNINAGLDEIHTTILEWAIYRNACIEIRMKNLHETREVAEKEIEVIMKKLVTQYRPKYEKQLRDMKSK